MMSKIIGKSIFTQVLDSSELSTIYIPDYHYYFKGKNVVFGSPFDPFLEGISDFTFSNAGQTGPIGPLESTLIDYYSAVEDDWAVVSTAFECNFGYQSFDISPGVYTVTMDGASGGADVTNATQSDPLLKTIENYQRAPGARVSFTLTIASLSTLTMVIGQGGADDGNGWGNPGGGGGTFLTLGTFADVQSGTDTLIAAAGGGGGFDVSGANNISYGVGIADERNTGANSGGNGTTGNGATGTTGTTNSGGGGGYLTSSSGGNIQQFTYSHPLTLVAYGFRQGALGAKFSSGHLTTGGFGGGGGGSAQTSNDQDKGGGGGYSGGGYAFDAYRYGGGGGSYANPTYCSSIVKTSGGATGRHGFIRIQV
jgi:hypothetical protein